MLHESTILWSAQQQVVRGQVSAVAVCSSMRHSLCLVPSRVRTCTCAHPHLERTLVAAPPSHAGVEKRRVHGVVAAVGARCRPEHGACGCGGAQSVLLRARPLPCAGGGRCVCRGCVRLQQKTRSHVDLLSVIETQLVAAQRASAQYARGLGLVQAMQGRSPIAKCNQDVNSPCPRPR